MVKTRQKGNLNIAQVDSVHQWGQRNPLAPVSELPDPILGDFGLVWRPIAGRDRAFRGPKMIVCGPQTPSGGLRNPSREFRFPFSFGPAFGLVG